jgi:excisionase family DNA binding protein
MEDQAAPHRDDAAHGDRGDSGATPQAGSWHCPVMAEAGPRFLKMTDVAEELNVSNAQVYALVRSGDLPAIKIGGGVSGGSSGRSWRPESIACAYRMLTSWRGQG